MIDLNEGIIGDRDPEEGRDPHAEAIEELVRILRSYQSGGHTIKLSIHAVSFDVFDKIAADIQKNNDTYWKTVDLAAAPWPIRGIEVTYFADDACVTTLRAKEASV